MEFYANPEHEFEADLIIDVVHKMKLKNIKCEKEYIDKLFSNKKNLAEMSRLKKQIHLC